MLFALLVFSGCSVAKAPVGLYASDTLKVERLGRNTYLHISYLETESFGKVPCNGLAIISRGEALILDTPVDEAASRELLNWIEKDMHSRAVAVVPTHFHDDCLGGLRVFHDAGARSYANALTIELAAAGGSEAPQQGFETFLELEVGNIKVASEYLGPGHTRDNIVSYIPSEKILFGGCLVKSLNAGKGYLGDADTQAWPATVRKAREKYGKARWVVPGHGQPGSTALLDYTAELFSKD